jgi:hypothetical protein
VINDKNTFSLFVDDPFVSDVYIPRTGIPQGVEHDVTSVCQIGYYHQ